nr:hypothetical protein HmN_000165700 [Hymenolepis microstoma]
MCCIKWCIISGPWRIAVWVDEFTTVFVEPFHPVLATLTIRVILPCLPKPRPTCEFCTYFLLMWPLEYYRKCTFRDRISLIKLLRSAACFLCEVSDLFDPADMEGITGMPEWKHYMLTGTWPWEEAEDDDDDDEDSDDEDSEID